GRRDRRRAHVPIMRSCSSTTSCTRRRPPLARPAGRPAGARPHPSCRGSRRARAHYGDMRTSTITAAGSRIRVIEDGRDEPAVLFVHGVGGWAENWAETIERVAATGRRAIAFDLPGFG